jgi:hypothetical protein
VERWTSRNVRSVRFNRRSNYFFSPSASTTPASGLAG